MIVEIESPGIGEASGKDLKLAGDRVITPDPGIDKVTFFPGRSYLPNPGVREDAMATIQATHPDPR